MASSANVNADAWSQAAKKYQGVATKMTGDLAETLLDLTEKVLPIRNDSIVLDCGAGSGELSRRILNRAPKASITAGDVAPGMLEVLKASMPSDTSVKTQVLDAEKDHIQQGLDANSFTHVLSTFMHQFIQHPDESLDHAYQILQPEGVAGIAIYSKNEFLAPWNRACKNLDPSFEPFEGFLAKDGTGAKWQSTGDMETAFRKAGFDQIQSVERPYRFNLMNDAESSAQYWLHGQNPLAEKAIAQWKGDRMEVKDELTRVIREEFDNGSINMIVAYTVGKKPAST